MISRRRWRARSRALGPIVAFTIVNILCVAFLAGPAIARGLNYGAGLTMAAANGLYCQLSGGANCTMTGGTIYSNVTNDITSPGSEDLRIAGGGSVVLKDGDNNVDVEDSAGVVKGQMSTNAGSSTFSLSQNLSSGARVRLSTSFTLVGRIDDANTTTTVACVADGLDTGGGGNCVGVRVYGDGLETQPSPQTTSSTCAANVLALDPKSSVVIVDGNAATCTVTLAAAGNVATINEEGKPIRISAKNVGASTVKIASTNFATALPAKCSTTGLALGQSALVAWDKDQSKWTFLGGCE